MAKELNRRDVIKLGALTGAALFIPFEIPTAMAKVAEKLLGQKVEGWSANAFVRIGKDNSVTILVKHLEMGQGVYTGLPTILAEELDADWDKVRVESAPANAALYNNLNWGPAQGTGGSSSVANSWMQLREAGAKARAMLVQAAAAKWNVPPSDIKVENGVVSSGSNKATFGELVEAAMKMPVPQTVSLKDKKDFKLIGNTTIIRKDGAEKSRGKAEFACDIKRPGQLVALISRPATFGAKLKNFNRTAAMQSRGCRDVFVLPQGIVVLADSYWLAKTALDRLTPEWDTAGSETRSSEDISKMHLELLAKPGMVAETRGTISKAEPEMAIEAVYEFPFLAHAPMEPMNAIIEQKGDKVEYWTGCQMQTGDQFTLAKILGVKPQNVNIHTTLAGGSFGRRATPVSQLAAEAAMILKTTKIKGKPIQVIWTREDDIRGGFYRPAAAHRVEIGLGGGKITSWLHRIATQSIVGDSPFSGMVKDGIDPTSVEGTAHTSYTLENFRCELHTTKLGVPPLWWRAVGSTHTAFVMETLMDEVAAKLGKDPVKFRLEHLKNHPRHAEVLKVGSDKCGWGRKLPEGSGLGIAVHEAFNTMVAQAAEVQVSGNSIKVKKVWCAVDCGVAVNPDVIKAQMEGGIGFALSAALHGEITLDKGLVKQSNFHDYRVLRINEMPEVEVYIIEGSDKPTGVGEPGVPPLAPAVANAIAMATGKRLRKLPLRMT